MLMRCHSKLKPFSRFFSAGSDGWCLGAIHALFFDRTVLIMSLMPRNVTADRWSTMCAGGRVPAHIAVTRVSPESTSWWSSRSDTNVLVARQGACQLHSATQLAFCQLASVSRFHGRAQTTIKLQGDLTVLSYSIRNIFQHNNYLFCLMCVCVSVCLCERMYCWIKRSYKSV